MTGEQLNDLVDAWRERLAASRESSDRHRAGVRARLPAVARLLRERFGVRRVRLFGSIARGDSTPRSDVDLLVDGLSDADLFEAEWDAGAALGSGRVDLVQRERARAEVLERANAEGMDVDG